jgi:hypothetical protein
MKIKFKIKTNECNGFFVLKILDKDMKTIANPKFRNGINDCNLELLLPNCLHFHLSGKNHKRDTIVDPISKKIIKDKSLQILDIEVDGKRLNKNRIAKMFTLETEDKNKINSAYWGFNGCVKWSLDYTDSLELHLDNLE